MQIVEGYAGGGPYTGFMGEFRGEPLGVGMNRVGGKNFIPLHRPYFTRGGIPAVALNLGRWTKQDSRGGEPKPVLDPITVNQALNMGYQSPVLNATSLRKEEWLELDRAVLRAARLRLRSWADLAGANSFGGFNGMAKMILEHETMSDPGQAMVDMDGITEGRTDAPKFQLQGLPLPITHSDFWFSDRKLMVSQNTATPLDTTMGEAAARRVAENIECTTIGVYTGITYGGNSTYVGGYTRTSTVFGYLNFPARLTNNGFTAPTTGGWVPQVLQQQLNLALNTIRLQKFYGPFMTYWSNDWDPYLDGDYFASTGAGAAAPTRTLRERLRAIDGIMDIRRLDFLTSTVTTYSGNAPTTANPFTIILVQMTPDVARAVNGMDITTLQWPSKGGMQLNFKVMAIQVPQLRADFFNNCGIMVITAH